MKKTIDQYFCDICGNMTKEDGLHRIKYPVIFHTDQTEGRASRPYISLKDIELCHHCFGKALKIHGVGAQGHNTYSFEEEEP